MHNRQSGAAHVPIMFFLLLLLMFFGALGFGWVQQTNNAELKTEVAQAKADLKTIQGKEALIQDYIADIGKVVNKPGPYVGRNGNAELYDGATIEYAGLMTPSVVKQVMDDAAGSAGVSQASSLQNLLGSMVTRINAMTKRVQDVELERDKVLADKSTGDQRYTALEGQAASSASENSTNPQRISGVSLILPRIRCHVRALEELRVGAWGLGCSVLRAEDVPMELEERAQQRGRRVAVDVAHFDLGFLHGRRAGLLPGGRTRPDPGDNPAVGSFDITPEHSQPTTPPGPAVWETSR